MSKADNDALRTIIAMFFMVHPFFCKKKKPARPGDRLPNGRGLLHDGVAGATFIYTDSRGIAV